MKKKLHIFLLLFITAQYLIGSLALAGPLLSGFNFGRYITGSAKVAKIKPRIVNGKYAKKIYPIENLPSDIRSKYPNSVKFKKNGYPDFSPYVRKEVKIEDLDGNYARDFYKANKAAGYERTPEGYTWHHHEDGKTMQLVPTDIHQSVRHSGGAAILRKYLGNEQ